MADKQYTIKVGYSVDDAGLNRVKTDLKALQDVAQNLKLFGKGDYTREINALSNAFDKSANFSLNKFDSGKDKTMEGTFADNGFPNGPGRFTYKNTKYEGRYDLNARRCLFISNNRRAYSCNIVHTPRFNEATAKQYQTEVNN